RELTGPTTRPAGSSPIDRGASTGMRGLLVPGPPAIQDQGRARGQGRIEAHEPSMLRPILLVSDVDPSGPSHGAEHQAGVVRQADGGGLGDLREGQPGSEAIACRSDVPEEESLDAADGPGNGSRTGPAPADLDPVGGTEPADQGPIRPGFG